MKLELGEKEHITITLAGTDGEFTISYDALHPGHLTVHADLPDSKGRRGIIYDEHFNTDKP